MTVDTAGIQPLPLGGATTRLRHAVTLANLLRHLDAPCRVLDAAGGHGRDAILLAEAGHDVTVLDPAGAMLTTAMELAEAHGVADRVHVVQAMAEDAPELFEADFDLVLCHNLLQYVEDRVALLRALSTPLRADGLLSVLGPNPTSGPLHTAITARDPERALAELGTSVLGCTADDVLGDLAVVEAEVLARYGVHCVSGYLPESECADPEFYAHLEALELAMSTRAPYWPTARYFHLVARR
ncbi:MAG: methyltransferase domain-containing protein [Actinomycetota bacterium]|nr:methyltransferase domain-containing protein [Actinomycetota bacterium]